MLTEFGREYRGMKFASTRGEKGEEVRKRIERWKDSVESAHRITSGFSKRRVSRTKRRLTEEDILKDDRLLRQAEEVAIASFRSSRI